MSLNLCLILACLKFFLQDKILKKSFWDCWRAGVPFSSQSALSWQGQQTLPTKEIVSPTSFLWGSFGHKVSESLSSTIKVAHGALVHLQRLTVLMPHDLGPKGFYPRRGKSGLEGMTWTLTMIRASEGALLGIAGRIKYLTFYFKKW
jgi:hypothetical protein